MSGFTFSASRAWGRDLAARTTVRMRWPGWQARPTSSDDAVRDAREQEARSEAGAQLLRLLARRRQLTAAGTAPEELAAVESALELVRRRMSNLEARFAAVRTARRRYGVGQS